MMILGLDTVFSFVEIESMKFFVEMVKSERRKNGEKTMHAIWFELQDEGWINKWHCVAMTW